jgi:AAA family ATP:ADP antiporter
MKDFLNRMFRLRPGETGLVLVLGFLLLSNSLAMQVSGIVAISGFLSEGGVNQILIVWVIDTLLIILMTGLQSLIVDRFDRITLMRGMTFSFALVFTVLRLLFTFQSPGWLNYSLLYLVSEQQWLFFPLIFWVLANDILDMAQTKRLFPLIASWGSVGRLLGIGVALLSPGLFSRLDVRSEEVLTLNVLIYMLAYLLMLTGLREVKVRQTRQKPETLQETLTEGWAFVREVPSFRYLMLSIVALIVCDTIIEFRFLVVSNQVFSDASSYQTFYSLYRLGLTLAAFAVQGFLTNRIIARISLKNTFLILPFTALAGATWMMALPGIISGIGGVVLQKLPAITVDQSARKAFQALVPEERRGRVSMFMDSYLFAGGTIIGCLVTGAIVFVGPLRTITGPRSGGSPHFYIYLAIAVLAALFAIWAVLKMRTVYESSLFNWRLKRRQRRTSVLDKLDF